MPIYDYVCNACDTRFEATRKIKERKEAKCPHCEDGVGQHKVSPVNFNYGKMGVDPDMPTAYAKWTKRHEEKGSKKHLGITE